MVASLAIVPEKSSSSDFGIVNSPTPTRSICDWVRTGRMGGVLSATPIGVAAANLIKSLRVIMVNNVSKGRAEIAGCEFNGFSNKSIGSVLSNQSTSFVSSIRQTYCHVTGFYL